MPAHHLRVVEREYRVATRGLLVAARRTIVTGRPVGAGHLAMIGRCCERLASAGVPVEVALRCVPVAVGRSCAVPVRQRGAAARVRVQRAAALAQQLSLVCLEAWESCADAGPLAPAPHQASPVATEVEGCDAVHDAPLDAVDEWMLLLVAEGRSNQQIASTTSYSTQAVRWHLARLMRRWQVTNRAALVTVGFQRGLLSGDGGRSPGRTANAPGPGTAHDVVAPARRERSSGSDLRRHLTSERPWGDDARAGPG